MNEQERLEMRKKLHELGPWDLLKTYNQYTEKYNNATSRDDIGYLCKVVVMIETEMVERMEGKGR